MQKYQEMLCLLFFIPGINPGASPLLILYYAFESVVGADQNPRKREGYCFVRGCFEASGCLYSKIKQCWLLSFLAKIL